jgi:hypothetical protein
MALTRKRALAIFKMLGEKGASAAAWADGETTDNEPYLARWLFLKALWSDVIAEDDDWMHEWSSKKHPVPSAIARMLAKGINPDDLTDVVRAMQVDLLFNNRWRGWFQSYMRSDGLINQRARTGASLDLLDVVRDDPRRSTQSVTRHLRYDPSWWREEKFA